MNLNIAQKVVFYKFIFLIQIHLYLRILSWFHIKLPTTKSRPKIIIPENNGAAASTLPT